MKKIMLVLAVFCAAVTFGQRIQNGESQINAGVGFTSGWGIPFYGGFDYGVHPDITVGAQISYASENHNYGYNDDVKGTWFGLGVNSNYHFNTLLEIPNEWDVYAGLTLAYNSFSWDYPSSYPSQFRGGQASGIGFSAQIGARYFFSDKFGINVEFGGGNIASGGRAGITLKL